MKVTIANKDGQFEFWTRVLSTVRQHPICYTMRNLQLVCQKYAKCDKVKFKVGYMVWNSTMKS